VAQLAIVDETADADVDDQANSNAATGVDNRMIEEIAMIVQRNLEPRCDEIDGRGMHIQHPGSAAG
jgi:hypothetical protein